MEQENKQPSTMSKSIHGGKWMAIGIVTQKVFSLLTFFILARLLMPEDYGIMAIILMITALVDRFTNHGLITALVQRREGLEKNLDAIWTVDIIKSLSLSLLIFILAAPISNFFKIPEALPMLRLSSLLVILPYLGNARQIYFSINLDFKKIFFRDLSGQIAYTIVALCWSIFIAANAWALIAGNLARLTATVIISYILYPSKPRLSFNFKPLFVLFNYSKWIAGQNILEYINGLISQVFVGRLLGADKLGFYSKAGDLASLTRSSLLSIISKVGFFSYNIIQKDLKRVQSGFLKSLNLMLIFTVPAGFFLLVEGGAIVSSLLGQRWLSIVLPLKILAIANIFIAIYGILSPLFDSLGRPDINFKKTLLEIIISLPFFYFGIMYWGIAGAAVAATLVALILLFYVAWQARKILQMGKDIILSACYHIALAMAPIAILAISFKSFVHSLGNDYIIFAWIIFLVFLYAILFWFLGRFFPGGPRSTIILIFNELVSGHKLNK